MVFTNMLAQLIIWPRWSSIKSKINAINAGKEVTPGTWLEKHRKKGCTVSSPDMKHVRITLLEHFTTGIESIRSAFHQEGPGCRCCECNNLKKMEDKWISRMGTYHCKFGLQDRDEISKTREFTISRPVGQVGFKCERCGRIFIVKPYKSHHTSAIHREV